MENFALTIQSKALVTEHRDSRCYVPYEKALIAEILNLIENGEAEKLAWFNSFGDCLRSILMNVHAYRKGLEFGFSNIEFDEHGWFIRRKFLDYEVVKVGNIEYYGQYSEIRMGRGLNGVWAYALSYSYGCSGGGSALSVYDQQFPSREAALEHGLNELKVMMTKYIGNSDTTNFKQEVLLKTLKSIAALQVDMVQMSLF